VIVVFPTPLLVPAMINLAMSVSFIRSIPIAPGQRAPLLGRLDAVYRRHEQLGLGPAEGDHADTVAPFVGVSYVAAMSSPNT